MVAEWHIEWRRCCLVSGGLVATQAAAPASPAKLQCVTGEFGGCKGPECVHMTHCQAWIHMPTTID